MAAERNMLSDVLYVCNIKTHDWLWSDCSLTPRIWTDRLLQAIYRGKCCYEISEAVGPKQTSDGGRYTICWFPLEIFRVEPVFIGIEHEICASSKWRLWEATREIVFNQNEWFSGSSAVVQGFHGLGRVLTPGISLSSAQSLAVVHGYLSRISRVNYGHRLGFPKMRGLVKLYLFTLFLTRQNTYEINPLFSVN